MKASEFVEGKWITIKIDVKNHPNLGVKDLLRDFHTDSIKVYCSSGGRNFFEKPVHGHKWFASDSLLAQYAEFLNFIDGPCMGCALCKEGVKK